MSMRRLAAAALLAAACCARAEAPPRNVHDLVALIASVKPDPQRVAQLQAELAKPAPADAGKRALISYYLARARAAEELGQASTELEARRQAYRLSIGSGEEVRHLGDLAAREFAIGSYLDGVRMTEDLLRMAPNPGMRISANARLSHAKTREGAAAEGDELFKRAEAAYGEAMASRGQRWYRHLWTALLECQRGVYWDLRGKRGEAEAAYRKGIEAANDDIKMAADRVRNLGDDRAPPAETSYMALENCEANLSRNLLAQGRASEAELLTREQIRRLLGRVGRDAPYFAGALASLADIMLDQGRFADAEVLAQEAVAIHERNGAEASSNLVGSAHEAYAQALFARGAYAQALAQLQLWTVPAAQKIRSAPIYLIAGAKTGNLRDGVATAAALLRSFEARLGANHGATGAVRGAYAMLLRQQGDKAAALENFRLAFRTLVNAQRRDGEGEGNALGRLLLDIVAEEYMGLLGEMGGPEFSRLFQEPPAAEAFEVADAVRAGSVQKALALAAARASADPQLAASVRREQDLSQEMESLYGVLVQLSAAPPEQRLTKVMADMRARIEAIRREHDALAAEIEKRFPSYANLINPRPPSLAQARAALHEGEALLAILTGEAHTFVWGAQKTGPLGFQMVDAGRAELTREVAGMRRAVDPFSHGLAAVPQFDLAGAYALYARYVAPVAPALRGASEIIIAANGPLASVPLAMLQTAPPPPSAGDPRGTPGIEFSAYRQVPWLIRDYALTQVPSINAFVTLRSLPRHAPGPLTFAGYGDPFFSRAQADRAQQAPQTRIMVRGVQVALRNAPHTDDVDSADLARLPRLPDTADEIREIAQLLGANPDDSVFLNARANEREVERAT